MNIKKFAANLDSWGIPPISLSLSLSLREYIDSSVCGYFRLCERQLFELFILYTNCILLHAIFRSQNGLISTRGIIFHELVDYFSDLEAKKLYSNEPTRVYALILDHRLLSVIETSTVTRQSNSS